MGGAVTVTLNMWNTSCVTSKAAGHEPHQGDNDTCAGCPSLGRAPRHKHGGRVVPMERLLAAV